MESIPCQFLIDSSVTILKATTVIFGFSYTSALLRSPCRINGPIPPLSRPLARKVTVFYITTPRPQIVYVAETAIHMYYLRAFLQPRQQTRPLHREAFTNTSTSLKLLKILHRQSSRQTWPSSESMRFTSEDKATMVCLKTARASVIRNILNGSLSFCLFAYSIITTQPPKLPCGGESSLRDV